MRFQHANSPSRDHGGSAGGGSSKPKPWRFVLAKRMLASHIRAELAREPPAPLPAVTLQLNESLKGIGNIIAKLIKLRRTGGIMATSGTALPVQRSSFIRPRNADNRRCAEGCEQRINGINLPVPVPDTKDYRKRIAHVAASQLHASNP